MHPEVREQARTLPALTGLRAVAALAVVAWHLRGLAYATVPSTAVLAPLLDAGLLGVDVFFVLSGFVIAHTYAARFAAGTATMRDYLAARLARVYPVHLVTLVGVAVLVALAAAQGRAFDASVEHTALGFLGNVLMLQALPGIPAWNVPAWSISCEFAAYLIFPLAAATLVRLRPGVAVAAAGVVLVATTAALVAVTPLGFAVHAYYWLKIAGEFAAGALLWAWWRHRPRSGRRSAVTAAVALVVVVVGLVWLGVPWLFAAPVLALLVPALASASGPMATLLAHPVSQWGGRISYSLYLVHAPLITAAMIWVLPANPGSVVGLLLIAGLVVASIAVAALVHHGVEEPARRLLRRALSARTFTARPGVRAS